MKKKLYERNWALIITASIVIIINIGLLILAIAYATKFGWASVVLALGAVSAIGFATLSIVYDDPSWLLLDLILG